MQRRRWVIGNLQNIENFSKFFKFRLIYKCTSFFLGFVSGVISLCLAFYINIPKVSNVFSYASFDWNNNVAFDFSVWVDRITHINSNYNEIFRPLTDIQIFDSTLALILLFSWVVWLFSYQAGLFLNLRYTRIGWFKRIILHIQTFILAPFLGLLESFPAFYSVIEFYFYKLIGQNKIKSYDFYVVKK